MQSIEQIDSSCSGLEKLIGEAALHWRHDFAGARPSLDITAGAYAESGAWWGQSGAIDAGATFEEAEKYISTTEIADELLDFFILLLGFGQLTHVVVLGRILFDQDGIKEQKDPSKCVEVCWHIRLGRVSSGLW